MSGAGGALVAMRRFARDAESASRCERCGAGLPSRHRHMLDGASGELRCSCEACAASGVEGAARPVPTRVRALHGMVVEAPLWHALGVPVALAFFRTDAARGTVTAVYPGPGGATQTEVQAALWEELRCGHAGLRELAPEIEGLIANRLEGAQRYYIAPVDDCYRLVGLVRAHYRGHAGGAELRGALQSFFSELDLRAASEAPRA